MCADFKYLLRQIVQGLLDINFFKLSIESIANGVQVVKLFPSPTQEGCGMRTEGLHTQVYKLNPAYHPGNLCLAGTAEVGLAGMLSLACHHVPFVHQHLSDIQLVHPNLSDNIKNRSTFWS